MANENLGEWGQFVPTQAPSTDLGEWSQFVPKQAAESDLGEWGAFVPKKESPAPATEKAVAETSKLTVPNDSAHNAAWNASRVQMAVDAQAAGLPSIPDPRERLIDALNRSEKAGYPAPHFIGLPNEPTGDRAPTMDIESLVGALKQREARDPSVSKERAYWESQLKNGMTAQEWKSQTGENDPVRLPVMTLTEMARTGMTHWPGPNDPTATPEAQQPQPGADPALIPAGAMTAALRVPYDLSGIGLLERALPKQYQVGRAITEGLGEVGAGFTTPSNLALLAIGGPLARLGKLGTVLLSSAFEAQAIIHLPGQYGAFKQAIKDGRWGDATKLGIEMGAGLGLPAAAPVIHASTELKPGEVKPNAVQEPSPETLGAQSVRQESVGGQGSEGMGPQDQGAQIAGAQEPITTTEQQKAGEQSNVQQEGQIAQEQQAVGQENQQPNAAPSEQDRTNARVLSGGQNETVSAGAETPPVTQAADELHLSNPAEVPTSVESPKINSDNGGAKPPPSDTAFAPNTPPESNPDLTYAMRTSNVFKNWWEKYWPRDLSVTRVAPDSPVITAHQRLIKSDIDYMENFAKQPWWETLRKRGDEQIIDLEDQIVKRYYQNVENGLPKEEAYGAAMKLAPPDIQELITHRNNRLAVETKAATDLVVDPPVYRGEPYIARLTNEEGQAINDLHPQIGNLGRQIRSTIGSFDNSRIHPTMKEGIKAGTQYEPVKRAVWLREITSARLEATANLLNNLKGKVLFDTPKEALAASPTGKITKVRGLGGKDYYARTQQEGTFLEQNLNTRSKGSALARMVQLSNAYIRNPSLVNPLPHTTKNMFFKYILARVGNAKFKLDTAEFSKATKPELMSRFEKVMPMTETGERMPQLTAREVGSWTDKLTAGSLKINKPSTWFIFAKADPAMRYALWKSYIRKGMGDQEAANHVWLDLIRYDANSGGMSFWKSIPFNFFVPWRTGTYVTLAKQFTAHPIRTLLTIGAIEYLREMRYRQTGRWTHLPVDYIDAPLAEAIKNKSVKATAATAATVLVFGPGGGQAPNTIKDVMETLQGDPQNKARVLNMFWGLSQIYNLPRDWLAYERDKNPQHLVNLLMSVSLAEHSALKYEPRRLMQYLPEWMPGLQKSQIVLAAEQMRNKIEARQAKAEATHEARSGVSRTFMSAPEEQQLLELRRAAGGSLSRAPGAPKVPR